MTITDIDKIREHFEFLERQSDGPDASISAATRKLAKMVFVNLWAASDGVLPVPAASAGPDGIVFYSWDKGDLHFEAEIRPTGVVELFYRNRGTEESWMFDCEPGFHRFPAEVETIVKELAE